MALYGAAGRPDCFANDGRIPLLCGRRTGEKSPNGQRQRDLTPHRGRHCENATAVTGLEGFTVQETEDREKRGVSRSGTDRGAVGAAIDRGSCLCAYCALFNALLRTVTPLSDTPNFKARRRRVGHAEIPLGGG